MHYEASPRLMRKCAVILVGAGLFLALVAAIAMIWRERTRPHAAMRLKIVLPATWARQDNPDGPATFCRQGSASAFQVSWAEYRGGKPLPEITAVTLKQKATIF